MNNRKNYVLFIDGEVKVIDSDEEINEKEPIGTSVKKILSTASFRLVCGSKLRSESDKPIEIYKYS